MTDSVVRVELVGPFRVTRDDGPMTGVDLGSRKARLLLKLLAVERPNLVAIDRIVDTLWGSEPPQRPAENVATLVSRLRKTLGAGAIGGGREGYRLANDSEVLVDLDEAARYLDEAERRLAAGEPALALAAARRGA